jgi:hypothetical protein
MNPRDEKLLRWYWERLYIDAKQSVSNIGQLRRLLMCLANEHEFKEVHLNVSVLEFDDEEDRVIFHDSFGEDPPQALPTKEFWTEAENLFTNKYK